MSFLSSPLGEKVTIYVDLLHSNNILNYKDSEKYSNSKACQPSINDILFSIFFFILFR